MNERNINPDKIKKEAGKLLEKFAKALEKVEKEGKEEDSFVDREEFEREEGGGECCDPKFKKRILANAPNKDEDFIIAETGGWK